MPIIASSPATTMKARNTPESSTCSLVRCSTSSHTTASDGRPSAFSIAASAASEIWESISTSEMEPSSFSPSARRSAITMLVSSRATSTRITSPSGRRAAPGRWTMLQTEPKRSSVSSVACALRSGATIRRWITGGAYCGRRAWPAPAAASILPEERIPGGEGRVREVGEQAVDAERVEQRVLLLRAAGVVARDVLRVVAERPGMDLQTAPVGAADQRGGPRGGAITLVDLSVPGDVVRGAVVVRVRAGGGD